jgi:FhuF 2Fe-2S C-terminal domain
VLHAAVPHKQSAAPFEPPRAHPLTASVAAVDRAVKLLSFRVIGDTRVPADPRLPADTQLADWIACDHVLSDSAFFARWRSKVARWLTEQHAVPAQAAVPEKTTGGYVLQWYLIVPSYLGALLFHSARRVPTLAPQQLSFRLDSAVLREVALRPGRFWCLPDDPDAGHPDAVPVPDEAALATVLRDQVIAHANRFLTVYGRQVRFGRRTKWATVTDVLDSGMLLAGRAFGSPQAGASDARLVLGGGETPPKKPLTSASTICEQTDDRGRTHWTRRRGSCCFLYALPGIERPCASCPRLAAADRARIYGTLDQA